MGGGIIAQGAMGERKVQQISFLAAGSFFVLLLTRGLQAAESVLTRRGSCDILPVPHPLAVKDVRSHNVPSITRGRLGAAGTPGRSAESLHKEVQPTMSNPAPNHTCLEGSKRVLLVDQSDESRDVLRTVLERRGVEIFEAPTARTGLELVRLYRPNVIVLDAEVEAAEDDRLRAAYDDELAAQPAEMVVLGNLRGFPPSAGRHVVRKPYHYGPLVRMIQQLAELPGQEDGNAPASVTAD